MNLAYFLSKFTVFWYNKDNMPEQQSSVIELQKTFEDMVGSRANAKISEEGAFASAEKIVDLDEKLVLKTTAPIDLYSAAIATSQRALSGRSDLPGITSYSAREGSIIFFCIDLR